MIAIEETSRTNPNTRFRFEVGVYSADDGVARPFSRCVAESRQPSFGRPTSTVYEDCDTTSPGFRQSSVSRRQNVGCRLVYLAKPWTRVPSLDLTTSTADKVVVDDENLDLHIHRHGLFQRRCNEVSEVAWPLIGEHSNRRGYKKLQVLDAPSSPCSGKLTAVERREVCRTRR